MNPELIDRLRDDLIAADFSSDTVTGLLGASADSARARGIFTAASRALAVREDTPLTMLTRLFLLGEPCVTSDVDRALPTLRSVGAATLGLVAPSTDGRVVAALSLNPVTVQDADVEGGAHWWILSDLDDQLRGGPARPDHVMGVGGATRSLIAMLPPGPAARSLDLGTGCGVVALHLSLRGPTVATDISERALTFAEANARLNGVRGLTFRRGDLYAAVDGEEFDLIASNPPFVISPPTDADASRYEYRDAGLEGDRLAETVVKGAVEALRPGGVCVCLANWEYPWGTDGLDRARSWLDRTEHEGADGWIIERDQLDPLQYAETWARDGGLRPGTVAFDRALDAWLEDFAQRRIVRIGLGLVRLARRLDSEVREPAVIRVERATGSLDPASVGRAAHEAFITGVRAERMSDEAVLATHWRVSRDVTEHREHRPGREAPHAITLSSQRGISRSVIADPLLAAAVGACDGDLSLGQIAGALASILEVDEEAAQTALVREARELAWLGMLSAPDLE